MISQLRGFFVQSVRQHVGKASSVLCAAWPSWPTIEVMRQANRIQLRCAELRLLIDCIRRVAPCALLVFGTGFDSTFWRFLNHGGTTVFLEDNREWLQRITVADPQIVAHLVDYGTSRKDWKALLGDEDLLSMSLPDEVRQTRWDVILVDAPASSRSDSPGRMKSIYAASELAARSGTTDIFVHDCHRQVERAYCDRFLEPPNLVATAGNLRHYHLDRSRQVSARVPAQQT